MNILTAPYGWVYYFFERKSKQVLSARENKVESSSLNHLINYSSILLGRLMKYHCLLLWSNQVTIYFTFVLFYLVQLFLQNFMKQVWLVIYPSDFFVFNFLLCCVLCFPRATRNLLFCFSSLSFSSIVELFSWVLGALLSSPVKTRKKRKIGTIGSENIFRCLRCWMIF